MTPDDIERYGYGNEFLFYDLEQRIMADVVRRLKSAGVITRTADFQLNRLSDLGYSDQEIKAILKETLQASEDYINAIYDKALKTEYIDNESLYKAVGKEFIPFEENSFIQQIVTAAKLQTRNELKNMTKSLGFAVDERSGKEFKDLSQFYHGVLDRAMVDITTGSFDYNTALRKTVQQMTNSGVRWIDYETGHHNRITTASRRSVMTGLSNLTRQINEYNGEQLGTNDYEVAWHANARPSHREWQGLVWSYEELVSVCGLGTVEGLCGANCYHIYYPFIKGLSKRNWSDAWLRQQNEKEDAARTFAGKEYTGYAALQRQRVLETRMRAQRESIKLLQVGDGDPFDILSMQSRYHATMDEYVSFSKAMGLRQQKERIYMDSLGKTAAFNVKHISNIDVRKAMTKQLVNLSGEEAEVLKKMSGALSQKINFAIGHGLSLDKYQNQISLLDSALSKGYIPKKLTLFRKTVPEFILDKKDWTDDDMFNLKGSVLKNRIYTSTSLIDFEYPLRNVIMQIEVPKGFKGAIYLKELAYEKYKAQEEILFKRNLSYQVLNIEKKENNFIVKVRFLR